MPIDTLKERLSHTLLWLFLAASPTILGLIIGFVLSLQAGDLYNLSVPVFGFIGFIIGGFWAERIRNTIGLSIFFGRLAGMPELEESDKRD